MLWLLKFHTNGFFCEFKHFVVVVVFGSQCITNNTSVDIFWLDETFLAAWHKVIAWHERPKSNGVLFSMLPEGVAKDAVKSSVQTCELQHWIRRRERDVERAKSFHNGRGPSDWKTKLWENCPQHVGKVKKKKQKQNYLPGPSSPWLCGKRTFVVQNHKLLFWTMNAILGFALLP